MLTPVKIAVILALTLPLGILIALLERWAHDFWMRSQVLYLPRRMAYRGQWAFHYWRSDPAAFTQFWGIRFLGITLIVYRTLR